MLRKTYSKCLLNTYTYIAKNVANFAGKNSTIASLMSCQRPYLRKTMEYSQSRNLEDIQWILSLSRSLSDVCIQTPPLGPLNARLTLQVRQLYAGDTVCLSAHPSFTFSTANNSSKLREPNSGSSCHCFDSRPLHNSGQVVGTRASVIEQCTLYFDNWP